MQKIKYLVFYCLFLICFFQNDSCFAKARTYLVNIEDDFFTPKTLTIQVGQKVVWRNNGDKKHTVTSKENYFNSLTLMPGSSFSYTFTRPGIYHYRCTFHSVLFFGMQGTVVVK